MKPCFSKLSHWDSCVLHEWQFIWYEAQVKSAEGRLKPFYRKCMPTDMPDGWKTRYHLPQSGLFTEIGRILFLKNINYWITMLCKVASNCELKRNAIPIVKGLHALLFYLFFRTSITTACTIKAMPNPNEVMMNKDKMPARSPKPPVFIMKLRKSSTNPSATATMKIRNAILSL